jgi:hypothetical protein
MWRTISDRFPNQNLGPIMNCTIDNHKGGSSVFPGETITILAPKDSIPTPVSQPQN